ncbi:MAG TPA: HAD family hydrolase [Syntrophorhabdaceae bacterium]|nr:HAD family hydrolase [Syntrophorhabdaceae bacterium]
MKKIISFDLDGTLVNAAYGDVVWNYGIPLEYSKKYGVPVDKARIIIRREYESVGDHNLLWYEIDHWLKKFKLPISKEDLLKLYESYIEPAPHAEATLAALGRRYSLVIASNAARIFIDRELALTGLRGYFAHIVSATTDYRMVKKEKAFYKRLCDELQVPASQIVHVGDHPVFDYDVPASAGIESYHLTDGDGADTGPGAYINGRRTIKDLRELLDLGDL